MAVKRTSVPASPAASAKTGKAAGPDKRAKVEAVERALSILEAFADGTPQFTLTQLSARTGLYPSTVLRLFSSLQHFGYLCRDGDGLFRLGPALWRIGVRYKNVFALERHVRPVLQRLVDQLGETATFYVRDGERRVCLFRRPTSSSIGYLVEEGDERPLDSGAIAQLLVAFTGGTGAAFEAIRRERVCVVYGARNPDINALAAPVFGHGEEFVGALSIVGPATRLAGQRMATSVAALKKNAELLSLALQGQ